MAVDKLVDSTQLDTDLTAVANAIRTKGGTSGSLAFPTGFVDAIDAIQTGGGGGGGATLIASGTFTGGDAQDITISIGAKMAQRDFYLKITAQTGTEFTYDTYYKIADIIWLCLSGIAHYDLSTNGTKKTAISDLSYTVNNNGTITTSAVGDNISVGSNIRNTSTMKNASLNQYKITKDNNGFSLYLGITNASYRFPSTVTYAYEIVYFGSNAATDVVEVA